MKLYAICLVKNEDDIIAQTLKYATRYCDKIFVLDNGSTDATWDIARELARSQSKIIPFEQTFRPYNDGLRAMVYNEVHQELSDEDWWMILDADEFLAEDPRQVIAQAMKEDADLIRAWFMQFYFTEKDVMAWEDGRDNRDLPISERRHYYTINWQEYRLFRNRPDLQWRSGDYYPHGLKKLCRQRIVIRHYQYRDPGQIEKRLRLRYGHPSFRAHVTSTDWRSVIRESRKLNYNREGEPWRFSPLGVAYYYRKTLLHMLQGKYRGAKRRLRRAFNASRE